MSELILFLRNWWFPILIAILIFLFWLLSKFVDAKLEECPFCGGSGKQWDSVYDSQDLQMINCEYCRGTGKKQKEKP